MGIDQIVQNNARILEIKQERDSGNTKNIPEARKLDDNNYRGYFSILHAYLSEELGTGDYKAAYFGSYGDMKVAESMPVKWIYIDKNQKYSKKPSKDNIKFEHADLLKGLPDIIEPESLDLVLTKMITYEGDELERQFPIYEALKKGGIAVFDRPILDNDIRYKKLEFFDDLRLESFGDTVSTDTEMRYWNIKKLHLYRKL